MAQNTLESRGISQFLNRLKGLNFSSLTRYVRSTAALMLMLGGAKLAEAQQLPSKPLSTAILTELDSNIVFHLDNGTPQISDGNETTLKYQDGEYDISRMDKKGSFIWNGQEYTITGNEIQSAIAHNRAKFEGFIKLRETGEHRFNEQGKTTNGQKFFEGQYPGGRVEIPIQIADGNIVTLITASYGIANQDSFLQRNSKKGMQFSYTKNNVNFLPVIENAKTGESYQIVLTYEQGKAIPSDTSWMVQIDPESSQEIYRFELEKNKISVSEHSNMNFQPEFSDILYMTEEDFQRLPDTNAMDIAPFITNDTTVFTIASNRHIHFSWKSIKQNSTFIHQSDSSTQSYPVHIVHALSISKGDTIGEEAYMLMDYLASQGPANNFGKPVFYPTQNGEHIRVFIGNTNSWCMRSVGNIDANAVRAKDAKKQAEKDLPQSGESSK